jgi:flagellin
MFSVLTNVSALTALQSLAMTQKALQTTENQVSTGLKISSASDNASSWSIATSMKSDNGALDAVSSALAESSSSIDVASSALNSTIDVLQSMKNQIITAKNPGTDLGAINTQLSSLSNQLNSITQGASFNGQNFLDGSLGGAISVVSGFHRSSNGSVSIDTLQIGLQSLNSAATGATTVAGNEIAPTDAAFASIQGLTDNTGTVTSASYGSDQIAITQVTSGTWATGDTATVTTVDAAGNTTATTYTFIAGATSALDKFTTSITSTPAGGSGTSILVQGATDVTKLGSGSGNTAVTTANASALESAVDAALTAVTTYASQLGSTKSQITQQQTFVSNLSNSLTAGVGSLVDADMNVASTKLQALQTQQQLGIQSLSIANQNSQLILKLFQGG